MKKYTSLGELLVDYREYFNLSQLDLAALLDVDARTINRWEKDKTLIKPDKEKDFVKKLLIPHQVIHNLNTDHPISVFYNIRLRSYSLTEIMQKSSGASWYISGMPTETDRIHYLVNDTDVEFVNDIQEINKNPKPLRSELIKEAARLLPELNLVLHDHSGFYAGHISFLPLKFDAYMKIRRQEKDEGSLEVTDLVYSLTEVPLVFYFYSIYADSFENSYYLANRILSYFREKKFKDYICAGISYREPKIEILREMGLKIIWEDTIDEASENMYAFLEGNFDMFLFGKMS